MERSAYLVEPAAHADRSVLRGLTARAALAATVAATPDGLAYVDGPLRLTWREVAVRVDALARTLGAAGVGSGDVVGVHLANSAAFAIAHLALAELGAVTLPLHVPYRTAELVQLLGATDAVGYIGPAGGAATLDVLRAELPALQLLVDVDYDTAGFTLDGRIDPRAVRVATLDPDTPFALVPTSGTESPAPKLCMHAHDGLLSNAHAFVDGCGATARDVLIVGSGYTHLFGLLGLHLALLSGATMLALRRFDARAFLALAAREGATRAWAVPAQLVDLLAAAPDAPPLQVREIRTAGAAVGAELVGALRDAFGAAITVHWGMSELGGGITTDGHDPLELAGGIGRPIDGAQVRVVREDGADAAPGETGELWYRRADLFRGYYRAPDKTASAVTSDGWLRTGDLAALEPSGAVRFVGRAKDLVNRGGFKISAVELESTLAGHAAIRRCAIVAVPDARLGERACLVAELHPDATLALADVAAFLDARGIAKYKWPEHLLLLDALPMTATNKVAKGALRALAVERCAVLALDAS
jgi:acyl-CoA synthetase (AMP-forming)/AMP-acid ligase II